MVGQSACLRVCTDVHTSVQIRKRVHARMYAGRRKPVTSICAHACLRWRITGHARARAHVTVIHADHVFSTVSAPVTGALVCPLSLSLSLCLSRSVALAFSLCP